MQFLGDSFTDYTPCPPRWNYNWKSLGVIVFDLENLGRVSRVVKPSSSRAVLGKMVTISRMWPFPFQLVKIA